MPLTRTSPHRHRASHFYPTTSELFSTRSLTGDKWTPARWKIQSGEIYVFRGGGVAWGGWKWNDGSGRRGSCGVKVHCGRLRSRGSRSQRWCIFISSVAKFWAWCKFVWAPYTYRASAGAFFRPKWPKWQLGGTAAIFGHMFEMLLVDNLRLKSGWRCVLRWTVLNCRNDIIQTNAYVELNNISHGPSSQGSTTTSE